MTIFSQRYPLLLLVLVLVLVFVLVLVLQITNYELLISITITITIATTALRSEVSLITAVVVQLTCSGASGLAMVAASARFRKGSFKRIRKGTIRDLQGLRGLGV